METADFIYNYSKIYLAEIVKEVNATENWMGKDFDVKYARFLQEYINAESKIKLLEAKIGRPLSAPECEKFFVGLTKIRMRETYDYISELFVTNIRSHKTLTVDELIKIEKRISPCRRDDEFCLDFLDELWKIEEELLGSNESWK